MPPTTPTDPWPLPELQRARRAIVVVDVVESVRLMQEDESGFIDRWRRFVNEVRTEVLPAHGGRMVKSLGDGMLLEFEHVPQAVAAALAMQQGIARDNTVPAGAAALHLRIGVHLSDVVVDELDVFGAGVNLAARIAGLADPGGVTVSVEAREQLIDGLDARVEDIGDCFLKHVAAPHRVFRLAASHLPAHTELPRASPLVPRIAVLPLHTDAESGDLGASLADDLVVALGRCQQVQVVSRLTTAALAGRSHRIADLGQLLRVDYVISGTAKVRGATLRVVLELADARSEDIIWSDAVQVPWLAESEFDSDLACRFVAQITASLLRREMSIVHRAALPNLPGYAILLQSIARLHSLREAETRWSKQALDHLADRHPRAPEVGAWTAKWHMLQVFQRTSVNPALDRVHARHALERALAQDANHALTQALLGHVCVAVDRDLRRAEQHLRKAIGQNASEPLAWLFLSHVLACTDELGPAHEAVLRAKQLAPLDPMSYFIDVFAAAVFGAIGDHAQALACARRAVASNSLHLGSRAQLIIALVQNDCFDEARRAAHAYLALRPQASVQRFLDNHPAGDRPIARREADALLLAGLPL